MSIERMRELKNTVHCIAVEELSKANEKFPQFHSRHEGLGVLLEEVWEMRDELKRFDKYFDDFQLAIFRDFDCGTALNGLERSISAGLAEGIQVLAMAKKFRCLLESEEKKCADIASGEKI